MSRDRREINYLGVLWRRKWWIVPFILLGVAGSFAAFSKMTRLYRAGASVVYVPQTIAEDIFVERSEQVSRLRIIERELNSVSLLEKVAGVVGETTGVTPRVKTLAAPLEVGPLGPETYSITYYDPVPERAALLATTFATVFVDESRKEKQAGVLASREFLEEDSLRIQQELGEANNELAAYQAEHEGELPTDRETNRAEQVFLRTRITELDAQIGAKKKDRDARLTMIGENTTGSGGDLPVVAQDPRQAQAKRFEGELAEARLRYTNKHPKVIRLQASLDALLEDIRNNPFVPDSVPRTPVPDTAGGAEGEPGSALDEYVRLEILRLNDEINALEGKKAGALANIDRLERQIQASYLRENELAQITGRITLLKGRQGANQSQLQELNTRLGVIERDMDNRYELKEDALVPLLPFRPDLLKLLLAGLAGGVGLGVGLAFLLELTDRSVRTVEEVEDLLRADVIAIIPNMDRERSSRPKDPNAGSGNASRLASG